MAKSIKLKNNNYIDSSSVVHSKISLKELLKPDLLYDGYITPNTGIVNIGDINKYERLLIIISANYSYTTKEIPKYLFNANIGVNWQATDNRTATYYCTFSLNENGNIEIKWSGFTYATDNTDYPRYYGITRIYGYKY